MDEQRYELKRDIARRIKMLHIFFICVVGYFLLHIVVFIFCDRKLAEDFEKLRDNHLLSVQKVEAHRGSIYSRNGDVLATSILLIMRALPSLNSNPESLSLGL